MKKPKQQKQKRRKARPREWWVTVQDNEVIHDSFGSKNDAIEHLKYISASPLHWEAVRVREVILPKRRKLK